MLNESPVSFYSIANAAALVESDTSSALSSSISMCCASSNSATTNSRKRDSPENTSNMENIIDAHQVISRASAHSSQVNGSLLTGCSSLGTNTHVLSVVWVISHTDFGDFDDTSAKSFTSRYIEYYRTLDEALLSFHRDCFYSEILAKIRASPIDCLLMLSTQDSAVVDDPPVLCLLPLSEFLAQYHECPQAQTVVELVEQHRGFSVAAVLVSVHTHLTTVYVLKLTQS